MLKNLVFVYLIHPETNKLQIIVTVICSLHMEQNYTHFGQLLVYNLLFYTWFATSDQFN